MELSPVHLDVLTELINIGLGRAAGILNQMSKAHVQLQVPQVAVLSSEQLPGYFDSIGDKVVAAVRLPFQGRMEGQASLVFPPESAANLVSIIIGQANIPFDEDSLRIGTLEEVGNIVLNGVMGSISNVLKNGIEYYPPAYYEDTLGNLMRLESMLGSEEDPKVLLVARTLFSVENLLIEGEVLIVFRLSSFSGVLAAINRMLPPELMENSSGA